MVRKSALVFGILCSAWFVLDFAATNAEACGGCRRRCGRSCGSSCYSSCYAPPVCSPCGGGCGGGWGGRCGGGCGGGCATAYYGAPAYAAPSCSTCSSGYAVPGAYGYAVRVAPPSYLLSRAGVPSQTYPSSAGYPSYAAPVTAYRTNTVFRTSYAAPLR